MIRPRIRREMFRDRALRAAMAVLGAAAIVLVLAVVSAVRIGSVEAAVAPASVPDSALRFASPGPAADIAASVARDLFTDDRQAPARRYRLPGETDFSSQPAAPRPVVLGTAVGTDGASFAMCQLGDAPVSKARIGGTVGEYTVVSIERGRVTFRGTDGQRFTVEASKPAP